MATKNVANSKGTGKALTKEGAQALSQPALDHASEEKNTLIFSYLELRKTIGTLGMLLPVVVAAGAYYLFHRPIQGSISSYYYTGMRDVFVGILWAIGFFLYSYRGYDRADNIAGNLAGLFAVLVSLFPTAPDTLTARSALVIGNLHLVFATGFFGTLIYFSLFLFTLTNANKESTPEKLKRNIVYRICGYTMAACIVLVAVYYAFFDNPALGLTALHSVFWLEAIAIVAFGFSWFTKGEAIFWDTK